MDTTTNVLPSNGGRRLVLLPLPLQGHINPMLQLANILHSKGFSITILHARLNSPNPTNYPHFNFLPIPEAEDDSLSDIAQEKHSISDVSNALRLFTYLNSNCIDPIRDCLARLMLEDEGVSCLITDAQWFGTQSVADGLKLPRIVHRTSSVSSFLSFAALPLLRDMGYIRPFSNEVGMAREEGEWTEVHRRKRTGIGDANATTGKRNGDWRHEWQPRKDLFAERATTFYISNFSDDVTEVSIWNAMKRIGKVVDVYIARKRNKINKRFGFARFLDVENKLELERRIRGSTMGSSRLYANEAKFKREKPRILREDARIPVNASNASSTPIDNNLRSYADAVRGGNASRVHQETCPIELFPAREMKAWAYSNLVGRVASVENLFSLQSVMQAEGCEDLVLRYLGGLYVLVEFQTIDTAKAFINDAKDMWRNWFVSLEQWSPEFRVQERIATLWISGLPPHAWSVDAFENVAKTWGEVLINDAYADDNRNMAIGKVVILTKESSWICSSSIVKVDGTAFPITVVEDHLELVKFNPFGNLDRAQEESDSESEDVEDLFSDDELGSSEPDFPSKTCDQGSDIGNEKNQVEGEEEGSHNNFDSSPNDQSGVPETPFGPPPLAPNLNHEVDPDRDILDAPDLNRPNIAQNEIANDPAQNTGDELRSNDTLVQGNSKVRLPKVIHKHNYSSTPFFPMKSRYILSQSRRRSRPSSSSNSHRDASGAAQSESIDLNKGPRSGVSNEVSGAERNEDADGTSSPSSKNFSEEVRNTVEIGNMVGFQMEGFESEIRNIISGCGDVFVDQ